MNGETYSKLRRGKIANIVRTVLVGNGYKEVMTPIMRPGFSLINPRFKVSDGSYLRDCMELSLRKMVTEEEPKIFEIGPCFRSEEVDSTHCQEFYMMELYSVGQTIDDMVTLAEELVSIAVPKMQGCEKLSLREFIRNDLGLDIAQESTETLIQHLVRKHHYLNPGMPHFMMMEYIEAVVEPLLSVSNCLYFITDYPTCTIAVADRAEGLNYIRRFECFFNGLEVAHSFVDSLNYEDVKSRLISADVLGPEEEELLELTLKGSLLPTAGLGVGIDRLGMV